jgi:hypothetical protein
MKALVLVASRLHLGYIGCYGNEWLETPTLDRLAAEGVVFDQHIADQPDAAGAQRAWHTGCYRFPPVNVEGDSAFQEAADLFPLLADHGIETFLLSDDQNRSVPSSSAGWRHFRLAETTAGTPSLEPMLASLTNALDHLASYREWLLRVDLGILLPPWSIPDGFRMRSTPMEHDEDEGEPVSLSIKLEESEDLAYTDLQDRYGAAVTYLDWGVGKILAEVEQRGLLEDLLILITTDAGQKLGETTIRSESHLCLHEELIHIPLILRLPGKAQAGRRISALTQSVDVLPTLFEAFGVPLPAVHGQSLLPLARGEGTAIREYACAGLRRSDGVEWALRTPQAAYLLSVSSSSSEFPVDAELYIKPDDRWEVNNVCQHHLELAERLEQALRCFVEATRRPGLLQPPKLDDSRLEPQKEEHDRAADSTERGILS